MSSNSKFVIFTIFINIMIFSSTMNIALLSRYNKISKRMSFSRLYNSNKESIIITSESNEKVKLLKSLNMKKKRDTLDLVLLEGHRQIIDAIKNNIIPQYILCTSKALHSAPLSDTLKEELSLLNKNNNNYLEIDLVSDSIMNSLLSDTVTSQGVIASFFKPKVDLKIIQTENLSAPLILISDKLADPGNVGTIVRSSYGLGVSSVISIEGGCDIWSPKVLRSSMGTCLRLPIVEMSWDNTYKHIEEINSKLYSKYNKNLQIVIADSFNNNDNNNRIIGLRYDKVNFTLPTVLVIGSEATGVSKYAYDLPGKISVVQIPMTRELESFNAAVACSILLGEANRQRFLK